MTQDLAFIDWDNDGHEDIIIHYQIDDENWENQISLLRNLGDGNYSNPEMLIPSLIGDNLAFTEIEDVDQDGDFDIVLHLGAWDIGWFRNDGTSFSDWILIFDYPDFPGDFHLADINRDNHIDVVWCGHLGVYWKENLGNFNFSDIANRLGPNEANRATNKIEFGDINGDSAIDLVAMGRSISGFPQRVRWYENRFPKTSATFNTMENLIKVYPNPVNDYIFVDGNYKFFKLYKIDGQLLAKYDQAPLDVSSFKPGIYLLNMHNSRSEFDSKRIMIGR